MAALETAFHYQQTDEILGQLVFALRIESVQVDAVMDDTVGFTQGAVNCIPPVAREIALIDNLIRQPAPDERELQVHAFGSQIVFPAGGLLFVQPVHAVQTLNDTDVLAFGVEEFVKLAGCADDQHSLCAGGMRVVMGGDAQSGQAADQFCLKRGWPAGAFELG